MLKFIAYGPKRPGLPRDQFSGPWLFSTAEARTINSSSPTAPSAPVAIRIPYVLCALRVQSSALPMRTAPIGALPSPSLWLVVLRGILLQCGRCCRARQVDGRSQIWVLFGVAPPKSPDLALAAPIPNHPSLHPQVRRRSGRDSMADWKTALRGNTERTLTAAAGPPPRDPYRQALTMRPSLRARPLVS